ncbi:hypothetical protein PC116_g12554 [Phytophthora cactorum]|uniref:Uncharacterized protein n=1 Tax=Phytophthora cactorum TaxID=29920 RepID=A0A8T1KUX1_9STRA|nr:hypothetical protein Pcac1_g26476 [Phytophthora cactorum]KAG2910421.1 hypothetical protein PC114_g9798 [Phytophthora cactorum]KAG2943088.1 hypothetical protein PC117_g9564 [Phytophthora cactorum]KAG2994068.1 hypothetical protein PC120_g22093 [Phytophthora cactorum]KAG3024910.1 hypothetical protein PC119_g8304 [Phytophthora cactorum]
MGRAPTNARALWYNEYSQLQRLCSDIAGYGNWSRAVLLHLGMARTEATATAVTELHTSGFT